MDDFDIDYEDYDVMICNSIVKNKNFLFQARPKYLMFGDPIFHLVHLDIRKNLEKMFDF